MSPIKGYFDGSASTLCLQETKAVKTIFLHENAGVDNRVSREAIFVHDERTARTSKSKKFSESPEGWQYREEM